MSDPVMEAVELYMDAVDSRLRSMRDEIRNELLLEIRAVPSVTAIPGLAREIDPPKDGKDGRGIVAAFIRDAALILTMTDGTETNVGRVVGEDGVTPEVPTTDEFRAMIREEVPAPIAVDGVGIAAARMQDDSLVLSLTNGVEFNVGRVKGTDGADGIASREELESIVEARFADLQVRTFSDIYQGVFKPGNSYTRGQITTWGGSLWLSLVDTHNKPGDGNSDWKLVVKK